MTPKRFAFRAAGMIDKGQQRRVGRRSSTGSSPDPPRPGRLRLAGCHRRHAPLRGRDTSWDGRIGWGVRLGDRLDGRGCGVGWRDARRNGRVGLFCGHGSSLLLLAFARFYPQPQLRSGPRQHPGRIFECLDASGQMRLAAVVALTLGAGVGLGAWYYVALVFR
jgi:hypothetical protein